MPAPPSMSRGLTDPNEERREFAARYASLESTAAFASSFCERHGLDGDSARKLALIVEELLCNAIEHGFRRECDETVAVSLCANGAELSLLYDDGAPPFDPLAAMSESSVAIEVPADARAIGGLGLRLVGALAAQACYVREDGRNRLRITLRRLDSSSQ